jgi:hypothetical protein
MVHAKLGRIAPRECEVVFAVIARSEVSVARMKRSEIRGRNQRFPDCASLHPGYGLVDEADECSTSITP